MTTVQPFSVLYIGGLGRSGSTLLADILGSLPGFISVGELPMFWEHGWANDWQSSDGERFSTSPFWQGVLRRIQDTAPDCFGEDARRLCQQMHAKRHLSAVLPRRTVDVSERYARHFSLIYKAIAAESDARVIVDSGKQPFHAHSLSQVADLDFRIVHLIRDPRAVAHSRSRVKQNTNQTGANKPSFMARQSRVRVASRWLWQNWQMHRLARRPGRFHIMRYEDLAERPHLSVEAMFSGLALYVPREHLSDLQRHVFHRRASVAFTGNPSRFKTGEIAIRPDDSWKTSLSKMDYGLISALTWPLRTVLDRSARLGSPKASKSDCAKVDVRA